MSQWKRISLLIVFTLVFGIIAFFHESRLGKWIDNEVYEWDKYKIFVNLGNIIVKEQDGTNILSLGPTALIHRPNLLEVIVSTLGKK